MKSLVPLALAIVAAGCASAPPPVVPPPTSAVPPPSSIDPAISAVVAEELDHAVGEFEPKVAVALVVDVGTGAVLAAEGRAEGKRDPSLATGRVVLTGSTLKAFLWAAALDAKTTHPEATLDCAVRAYPQGKLEDSPPHGALSVTDALAASSSVAASRLLDGLGLPKWYDAFRRFHLADAPSSAPEIGDPRSLEAAMFASGEVAKVTPLQMARGYVALFHDGVYVAPGAAPERVVSSEAAAQTVALLEGTTTRELGTGKSARIDGMRVAGKTGTADLGADGTYASFIGAVLDRTPSVVILVGLEGAKGNPFGGKVAAPVFAKIAKRIVR